MSLTVRDRSTWTCSKANSATRLMANTQAITQRKNAVPYHGSVGVSIHRGTNTTRTGTPSPNSIQVGGINSSSRKSLDFFILQLPRLIKVDTNFPSKPWSHDRTMADRDPMPLGQKGFQRKRIAPCSEPDSGYFEATAMKVTVLPKDG